MATSAKDLYEKALDLSDAERAALAALLLESLDGEDSDVESAWLTEIERRMAELDSGAVTSVPWAQVRDRLLGNV